MHIRFSCLNSRGVARNRGSEGSCQGGQRCNHETEGRHRRNTTVLGILPSAWAARDMGLEQWLHRSEERGPARTRVCSTARERMGLGQRTRQPVVRAEDTATD